VLTKSRLSQGSIALYVGRPSDYRKFTIHKDLLVKHSDYFYAIFVNGGRLVEGWMEGKEREVTLATDHPEPFEMFQRFLYIGRIFSRKDNSNVKLEPDSEDPEWARLWSAWELGQKFLSTTFKDAITNAVYEKIRNDTYPVHAYERIYPKSSQISGIRKLLAESAVRYWSTEALMAQRGQSEAHHEFFFDLALALSAAHNQPGHFSNVHDCALVACR